MDICRAKGDDCSVALYCFLLFFKKEMTIIVLSPSTVSDGQKLTMFLFYFIFYIIMFTFFF